MNCDEGGEHEWMKPATACDYFTCFLCFPCYAFASCALSEGAAFANPVLEQACGGRRSASDETGQNARCRKCDLTLQEATDLEFARNQELGSNMPSYFNQRL